MSTIIQNTTDLQALLNKVNELPEAGGSDPILQDKTVTPTTSKQIITADSGYDGLDTVTVNAMPTVTQATPSISVSSAGLITASSTQSAGYVASGTKSATKQLTTQGAQTITPGTSNKTIASGRYLTGTQTIKGDANLVAGNIKKGVSIFGVTGTHEGGENLAEVIAEQEALITELSTALDNKASGGSSGGGNSVEWQDVFSLPTTYVPTHTTKTFYVEIPQTFNALIVRTFVNNTWYYSTFSIRDGINILSNGHTSHGCIEINNISNGVLGMSFIATNNIPNATIAEYLIV